MLLFGHSVPFVVGHLAIAIKRESIFDIAPDAKNCDGFVAGRGGGQPGGKRARGVGAIQQMNHPLGGANLRDAEKWAYAKQKQNQHHQHPGCDQPEPDQAKTLYHDQYQQRCAGGGQHYGNQRA